MKKIEIKQVNTKQILLNSKINKLFKNIYLQNLNFNNSILCGDFYLDTNNYYPITQNNYFTFPDQFDWQNKRSLYQTDRFKKNFIKEKESCKKISNAYVVGTSPGNNYYRNISTFLYRLYFITEKKINIAIHRNTSNNIREFIKYILDFNKVKLGKYIYLDDGFYLFKNSQIPGFLNIDKANKIYENFFSTFSKPSKKNNKIYISRRNAKWRKVLNEGDFSNHLEKEGFEIIDFENLTVLEQIKKIQSSNKIIAPHGSGLTNLIFDYKKNTTIEIIPKKIDDELKNIYLKYKIISVDKKNEHLFFAADLVKNDPVKYLKTRNKSEKKHVGKTNIRNNPYFKNFIVTESEFKKLVTNFNNH